MRCHIFAVGKPKLEFARLGIEEYASRLKAFLPVQIRFLKSSSLEREGVAMLEQSKAMFRVVLDERGDLVTSRELAKKLAHFEVHASRNIAILVGGAEGLSEEVRQAAGWVWSLSKLTLQHELALLLTLEQLYRACTIRAGLPYHRD